MLISRVASKARMNGTGTYSSSLPSVLSGESASATINDRKGSLNNLWSHFRAEFAIPFEKRKFKVDLRCDVMDTSERHWIPAVGVIKADGVLELRGVSNNQVLLTTSLFQCIVIGHLGQELIQIVGSGNTILIKCTHDDFAPVCASLFAYSGLRPSGIEKKLWFPPPGVALDANQLLLSTNVKAYFTPYNPLISQPWVDLGASLSQAGDLRLVNHSDQTVYTLQITKVLASNIILVDPSLVGSGLVLLLFPDLGGPETVYIRFNDRYECEEWVATLRAMSMQSVATPLSHQPSESIRWSHSLTVKIGLCEKIDSLSGLSQIPNRKSSLLSSRGLGSFGNSLNLQSIGSIGDSLSQVTHTGHLLSSSDESYSGKYIEICLSRWRFARTCIDTEKGNCNWNETFTFSGPEGSAKTPSVMELKLRRIDDPEGQYSESDQTIGSVTVTASSTGRWELYDLKPSNFRVSIFVEQVDLPVLDVAYYTRLNDWVSDINLNLAPKLIHYNSASMQNIFPIFNRIYRAQGRQLEWIFHMISSDLPALTASSDILFRETTLLTKAIESLLNQQGKETLKATVGRFVRKLSEVTYDALELDPSKNRDEELLLRNQDSMTKFMTLLWSFIRDAPFPPLAKPIFRYFKREFEAMGLKNDELRSALYKTLSSFLFLRFFVPALLNPQLYRLTRVVLNSGQRRTLILVAKILQAFSNRVKFGSKEKWLTPMNIFIERNQRSLMRWYDFIVSDPSDAAGDVEKPPKQVPVNTFMGMQLASPSLIDEPAVYSQLANYMANDFEKCLTEDGHQRLKEDPFVRDVLTESQHIVQRQERISSQLNEFDNISGCDKEHLPNLHLNTDTLLFGVHPEQLEPKSSQETHIYSTDAPFKDDEVKPKSLSVKKITQMLGKLGKNA